MCLNHRYASVDILFQFFNFGLNLCLFALIFAIVDIGKDLNYAQSKRNDKYRKKIIVAKHAVEPTKQIKKPLGKEEIVNHFLLFYPFCPSVCGTYFSDTVRFAYRSPLFRPHRPIPFRSPPPSGNEKNASD